MSREGRLVLVVDVTFDAHGRRAFEEALRLAQSASRVELHLVHVLCGVVFSEHREREEAALQRLRLFLAEQLAVAPSLDSRSVRLHVGAGDAAAVLLPIVERYGGDFLVVAARSERRRARTLRLFPRVFPRGTRDVTARVVARADVPVLVVRASDEAEGGGATGDGEMRQRPVLE
jgi:nucleotide-binding universal stress UspA family protein